jgi:hypothetical protein
VEFDKAILRTGLVISMLTFEPTPGRLSIALVIEEITETYNPRRVTVAIDLTRQVIRTSAGVKSPAPVKWTWFRNIRRFHL